MQKKVNRKTLVIILVIILALLAVVATVSAAEVSGLETAIAAIDSSPISGTDHRLISPWGIDAASIIW